MPLDPVCGMALSVADAKASSRHRDVDYYFCSVECQARFSQNPPLYCEPGRLGNMPPILKRRCLKLLAASGETLRTASASLLEIVGVGQARPGENYLVIEYDLRHVTLEQLEVSLEAAGLRLKGGLHQLRRNLWKFAERNELDNAADTGTGACCNRPPTGRR